MKNEKLRIKLEGQQIVVCRFAPAGRDVYSLAVFIYSGAPWERNRYCLPERRFRQVSLLTERDL
jgi:hypothetical protein